MAYLVNTSGQLFRIDVQFISFLPVDIGPKKVCVWIRLKHECMTFKYAIFVRRC